MKCTCGHEEGKHDFGKNGGFDFEKGWCMVKIVNGNNRDFCECWEFQPVEGARLL